MTRNPRKLAHALVVAVGLSISIAVSVYMSLSGPNHRIKIVLGGPHGTPRHAVVIPKAPVARVKAKTERALRSENPAGVSAAALDAGQQQQERLAETDQLPIVVPDAAPEQRGCLTRLVGNYSSRRGVRPRIFVLHYTVSANRPGWDDVYAIANWFNTPASQVSANYDIDNEGHCLYLVRESDKAWHVAGFNSVAIGAEVINTGSEPTYAGVAGLAKLALVVHDAAKRWQIPLQLGAVSSCTVTRPGIVDHNMLGPCGGGHHDITPFAIAPVIAAARALDQRPPELLLACTIRHLQRRLGIRVDGFVGPRTRAAIRALQRRHKIKVTGYAGVRVGRILKLKDCRV